MGRVCELIGGHTNCEEPWEQASAVTPAESSPLRGGPPHTAGWAPLSEAGKPVSAQQLPPPHPPAQAPRPPAPSCPWAACALWPAAVRGDLKSPPGACVWGPRSTRQHLAASQPTTCLLRCLPPPPAAASSHRPQADGTLQGVSDPLQEHQGGFLLRQTPN